MRSLPESAPHVSDTTALRISEFVVSSRSFDLVYSGKNGRSPKVFCHVCSVYHQ